jgi:hypothetical protein
MIIQQTNSVPPSGIQLNKSQIYLLQRTPTNRGQE